MGATGVRDFLGRLLTGVLVEKRNIEFSIFWLKRPCKSNVLRFFLKFSFFFVKYLASRCSMTIFFGRRPYGRSLIVEF